LQISRPDAKIHAVAKIHGSELNRISIKDVVLQPEFATVRVTSALFGLSRTQLFKLMTEGKINAIHYKQAGSKKGVRLIDLASVRQHLKTFAV
jgi:hypothetical protein